MKKSSYEKLYKWDHLIELFEEFLPELVAMQRDVGEKKVVVDLPAESKRKLEQIGFSKQGRNPKEVR